MSKNEQIINAREKLNKVIKNKNVDFSNEKILKLGKNLDKPIVDVQRVYYKMAMSKEKISSII